MGGKFFSLSLIYQKTIIIIYKGWIMLAMNLRITSIYNLKELKT